MRLIDTRNNFNVCFMHIHMTTTWENLADIYHTFYCKRVIISTTAVLSITSHITGCITHKALMFIVYRMNVTAFNMYTQKYLVKYDLESILADACTRQSYRHIIFLLQNYDEYDYIKNVGRQFLNSAVFYEDHTLIALLLEHGASAIALVKSLETQGQLYNVFKYLILTENFKCIDLLLDSGADYNTFIFIVNLNKSKGGLSIK